MRSTFSRHSLAGFVLLAASCWLLIPAGAASSDEEIHKIRDEGLNRSQVMETLAHLTEVIGPRLTASPAHKRASEWTRDRLAHWGCEKAHLEPFGPFGRGWTLTSFSAQVTQPQSIPVIAYPAAWSPGLEKPVNAPLVFLDATNATQLDVWKGKLRGAIVLCSPVREVRLRFDPLAYRLTETNLLRLANASPGSSRRSAPAAAPLTNATSRTQGGPRGATNPPPAVRSAANRPAGTNAASAAPTRPASRRFLTRDAVLSFLGEEGAVAALFASPMGDGGTLFVAAATVPRSQGMDTANPPRAWFTNAPPTIPQVTLATEDYNRLARMCRAGQKPEMQMDLRVQFHEDDLMAYNTTAEIPGTDLKDEVVMVGGHLDSWHASSGATDNAIGVAVSMEAMRILQTLGLKPRRTIRIGLWSGEEQGLLGSKAYVARHFGYWTNENAPARLRTPKDGGEMTTHARVAKTEFNTRKIKRTSEYEKFAAYFNYDNGCGKIRGIYLQGNESARPILRSWLEPFRDLGAETITLANTYGTDHLSFDAIGLPGFQFIQDPLDYDARTHHSNQDSYDRIQPEDAKQSAVIMAACAWNAAMEDERIPRKELKP